MASLRKKAKTRGKRGLAQTRGMKTADKATAREGGGFAGKPTKSSTLSGKSYGAAVSAAAKAKVKPKAGASGFTTQIGTAIVSKGSSTISRSAGTLTRSAPSTIRPSGMAERAAPTGIKSGASYRPTAPVSGSTSSKPTSLGGATRTTSGSTSSKPTSLGAPSRLPAERPVRKPLVR